jgi:pimeloyl-ACP methyl ester carboxylesterase
VEHADSRQVQRELVASALTGERPSAPTQELLTRLNLRERHRRRPDATLAALHQSLAAAGDLERLYALSELSLLRAEQTRDAGRAYAAALYAYAFLFDEKSPRERFDPRIGLARHFYNRALTLALASGRRGEVELAGGSHTLPFGALEVALDPGELELAGFRLEGFLAAAEFRVRGLDNRYREPGLGAPLSARFGERVSELDAASAYLPERLRVPATAFLRVENPRAQIASGRVNGRLELYTDEERSVLEVDGAVVPLERERSSSIALMLEGSALWDFGFRAFRLGDFLPTGQREQLLFLRPFAPDRIPLVLVHGTFSSPATWAQLANELQQDREIFESYQIWFFIYNSGNPLGWSAGILADALRRVVTQLDPEGRAPALRRMVVVGHSQGGLLAKLLAVESGDAFWRQIARRPIDELGLAPESRALLERSLFFEPLPFVERVVFMATPHRGSHLAELRIASWLSRLVKMPAEISKTVFDLATHGSDEFYLSVLNRRPTSLDNMAPSNRFLRALSALPLAPGVGSNSIIAVHGSGPYREGSDGFVRYTSAHLPDVDSEKVVQPSGHSVQRHQGGIQELRRILREHAGQGGRLESKRRRRALRRRWRRCGENPAAAASRFPRRGIYKILASPREEGPS